MIACPYFINFILTAFFFFVITVLVKYHKILSAHRLFVNVEEPGATTVRSQTLPPFLASIAKYSDNVATIYLATVGWTRVMAQQTNS